MPLPRSSWRKTNPSLSLSLSLSLFMLTKRRPPYALTRVELAENKFLSLSKLPLAAECDQVQSLSNAKRKIRKTKDNNWLLEWQKGKFSGATQTYVELGLKPTSRAKSLPEPRLKREV